MTGFEQRDTVRCSVYGSSTWRSSPPSFSQLTSPPAQNALSPAPVRTTTPTSSSAPASSNASVSSLSVSPVKALYCLGRLIVIRATWSFVSYRMSVYARGTIGLLVGSGSRLQAVQRRQDRQAAVDDDRLAGEKARASRHEIRDEVGDVLPGAGAPDGGDGDHPRDGLRVLLADAALDVHLRGVRLDEARVHAVHRDPERPQLHRERAHQALEGRLRRAQHAVARHRLEAVDTGDRHDAAGSA